MTRYPRALLAVAVAAVLLMAVLQAASGVAAGSSTRWSTGRGAARWSASQVGPATDAPDHSDPFAADVDALGRSQYPDVYGGVSTNSAGLDQVYVVTSGVAADVSGFETAVAGIAATDGTPSYHVDSVSHSYSSLLSLTGTIADDSSDLESNGIQLEQWGPNAVSNTVQIFVLDYSAGVVQTLQSDYGAAWITVSSSPSSDPATRADRTSDSAPFLGGDAIWFNDKTLKKLQCTSGFYYTGNNTGNEYLLIAGHCADVGDIVYTNYSDPQDVGNTTAQHFTNGGFDISTVYSDGLSAVWANGSTIHSIKGARDATTSDTLSLDGAATGEVTDVPVIATDQCVKFDDGITTCMLDVAYDGGYPICQGGDSGGPVYQRRATGGGVIAMGIIIGVDGSGDCFFQEIEPTLTLVNGTILTG
jgi:hypothetical protein